MNKGHYLLRLLMLIFMSTTTQTFSQNIQITPLQFGNVSLRDTAELTMILRNLSSESITIQNISLVSTLGFSLVSPQTNITLASQQTYSVRCRFIPRSLGIYQTSVNVDYQQGSLQQKQVIMSALSGRGVTIKIVPPPGFDIFSTGRRALKSVLLINTSSERIIIRQVSVIETTGTILLASSGIGTSISNIELAPQDSTFFPIRIEKSAPNPSSAPVSVSAQINVYTQFSTNSDTSSTEFTAVFVNRPPLSELEIEPAIRFKPDVASPGDTVAVEIYLSSLYSSTLADLFRIAQPSFSLQFSMNGNLAQSLNSGIRPLGTQFVKGRRTFQIGQSFWTGQDSVLFRGAMQVMAGDADSTIATIDNFQWGGSSLPQTVFVFSTKSGKLRVNTCTAGGKRLFTAAPATRIALHNTFPNPASTHVDIAYSLQEAQPVTLSLYNAQGNLIRTVKTEYHEAGEYTERVAINDLATGTYFVRLQGTNGVQQKAVSVVR